jgi:hypothetical protein
MKIFENVIVFLAFSLLFAFALYVAVNALFPSAM